MSGLWLNDVIRKEEIICRIRALFITMKSRDIRVLYMDLFLMLNYRNQCLSPLMLWIRISIRAGCRTLCDKVRQWLATSRWFFPSPTVFSTNKNDHHDITEILLKVALNTIKQINKQIPNKWWNALDIYIILLNVQYIQLRWYIIVCNSWIMLFVSPVWSVLKL